MRAFACASAISLGLLLAPAASLAASPPRRVASLNLCTDELLMLLAEPRQIASVTHLGQNPAETPLWRQGRAYPRNDGSLAAVAALRPDLVLTMGGGARDRVGLAARLGIPTVDLPYPQSLGDIEAAVARVSAALGHPERGRAVLARLAALKAAAPARALDAIWLGGGGRTVGASGLEAQWMRLAGLAQRPLAGDRVSLETLLVGPPAVLLRSDYRSGQYSAGQRWLRHPLAARARAGRTLVTDGRLWTCMGPLMIGEIARLRNGLGR
ncbi:MAG: ABC transporter substrate-binding protein [Alphaproteobacteria bacterium]|nr:ABC transporter substrate-binding protein [Alphaproteobacteria bacterium]MBV9373049.1 ABC transporter substrate-binding protein [Alphaproteobacteria bacterium]MBV9902932.1 ABC transporter substrate-binding protein [Alphaproteobacteria bacterium]